MVKEILYKKNGCEKSKAVRLGNVNKETQYVLNYLGLEAPELIEKVEEGQEVLLVDHNEFGCRAVGVIIKDDKILFQKRKNDANWALPGGAIATLETGEEVVLRELEEETGETKATIERPLWFTEYFFNFDNKTQHQYILGYLVNGIISYLFYIIIKLYFFS